MITNPCIFEGIEVEGKFKGYPTLFVASGQPTDKIFNILKEGRHKQVYLGACFQSAIDWDQVRYVHSNFPEVQTTIEVLLPEYNSIPFDILNNENIFKLITVKIDGITEKNKDSFQIKIENKEGLFCFHTPIFNSWNDYEKDIELSTS